MIESWIRPGAYDALIPDGIADVYWNETHPRINKDYEVTALKIHSISMCSLAEFMRMGLNE